MSSTKLERLKMLQVLALSAKGMALPVLMFRWLDAFFLRQGCLFREPCDYVRA